MKTKKTNLLRRALTKLFMGLAAMGLLLFFPAGTIRYWNGWLLVGLLFGPMILAGIYLWVKRPELLEKRLRSREKESEQKKVIAWSAGIFIASFLCAGLDFRYGWTHVPLPVVVMAVVVFLVAYGLYMEVMRENAYLSRTVEIQENQQVVDTGLYGVVRHPMYGCVLLLFVSMTLLLGSWLSVACMAPLPFILARRIKNEEEVLRNGLEGYAQYTRRVKYRMLPFVW